MPPRSRCQRHAMRGQTRAAQSWQAPPQLPPQTTPQRRRQRGRTTVRIQPAQHSPALQTNPSQRSVRRQLSVLWQSWGCLACQRSLPQGRPSINSLTGGWTWRGVLPNARLRCRLVPLGMRRNRRRRRHTRRCQPYPQLLPPKMCHSHHLPRWAKLLHSLRRSWHCGKFCLGRLPCPRASPRRRIHTHMSGFMATNRTTAS